jgi:hypothetical protein
MVFGAVVVVALPVYLWYGRSQWFFYDEWDFLFARRASNLDDLFRPHNEHWSTLPILTYRGLYYFFGLRTYVPYQSVSIVAHLVVAVLLYVTMRRLGVHPWIATAAGSLFALLGSANQDIVWAFQAAWSASLALGLTQLLLADHDGTIDRRDWLGVGAGTLALMCSGVGVSMAVAVAVATLLRRGWRVAAFHVVPLAVVFASWWLVEGRGRYGAAHFDVSAMAPFVRSAIGNAYRQLGGSVASAVVYAVLLIVGLTLLLRGQGIAGARLKSTAIGLAVAALTFSFLAALGRASNIDDPTVGRYVHVICALSLPLVAVATDAVRRRWPVVLPALVVVFLVGIPGNVMALRDRDEGRGAFLLGQEDEVRALPALPVAREVPGDVQPLRFVQATIGWLREQVRTGKLVPDRSPEPGVASRLTLALALRQTTDRGRECAPVRTGKRQRLERGDAVAITGSGLRIAVPGTYVNQLYERANGVSVVMQARTLEVTLSTPDHQAFVDVCR